MKFLVLFFILALQLSCKHSKKTSEPLTERYRLVAGTTKEDLSAWQKSKDWMEIDTETGNFKGVFHQTGFSGNFVIKKVSPGFAKGFYYTVELGFLEKNATDSKRSLAFFSKLESAKRLYFYPDKLMEPNWIYLEISSGTDSDLLKFILKKV